MQRKDYIFWVALPPVVDEVEFVARPAGLAEPLIDLRFGPEDYKRYILKKAVEYGLAGLTVFIDYHDKGLNSFVLKSLPKASRVILASISQFDGNLELSLNEFKQKGIVAGIEVDNRNDACKAQSCGADFIVASGNEACGPVSGKTSLVLVQELLEGLDIPLILRGSLGPQAAAGVLVAGCSGCILDSQVLLLKDSPVSDKHKKILSEASACDTTVIGTLMNKPYRFICNDKRDGHLALMDKEKNIFLKNVSLDRRADNFNKILNGIMINGFNEASANLPVGQGIAFSQQFAEKGLGVRDVLKIYHSALNSSIDKIKADFPFSSESSIGKLHNVKYPLVQGPMACITDNPNFVEKVAKEGALPFIALAGLSSKQRRALLKSTRSILGASPFGAGIVNFNDPDTVEEQTRDLLAVPPDFITIAGGDPGLARRFEDAGIGTYVYAATPAHFKNLLEDKFRGVILEGHEAGGHIGILGSLILWELAVEELLKHNINNISLVRVIFAGGLATARGVLITAALISPLSNQKIAIGLQIGTAYLLTDEAVESGAISAQYQDMLLKGDRTVITGQSMNLPTRWLHTPKTDNILYSELKPKKGNNSLHERKQLFEASNINNLRRALKNSNKKTQAQPAQGSTAYMCGQVIAIRQHSLRIATLHEELIVKAKQLAVACPMPVRAWELPEDAIAIVGMGCIFPDANNIDEYWENIMNRHCSIRELEKERCNLDMHFDTDRSKRYKSYSRIGAFVEGFKKDPLKFNIPPVSAPFIERIQFLMLEAAYQALEDAGYHKKTFPKERTAVLIGSNGKGEIAVMHHIRAYWSRFAEHLKTTKEFKALSKDKQDSILAQAEKSFNQDMPELSEDSCGGTFGSIVASRINNCFNLGGTSLVLDAACAASLAAVDLGIRGLRERRFDMVLAGAVDGYLNVGAYLLFSSLGALSAKGSFPFDERADGLVLGEGAGLIVLRRLDDAIRSGDKIYAVIRNIDASSDGRAKGITAPDVKGQIRALERTYASVPFSPDSVSLIEAHGTGTWAGDTAEMQSLIEFFRRYSARKNFVGLGSVKSMIGHLKSAAGIAGLIKVALAFYNKTLPPTMNCQQPRKDIDWEGSPFYLLKESCPWESGVLPRRAAINSFGFGGINYHAVLEEAPTQNMLLSYNKEETGLPAEILFFRAKTRKELIHLISSTKNKLIQEKDPDLHKIFLDLQRASSKTGPILTIVAVNADKAASYLDKACKMLGDESRPEFFLAQGIYFSQSPLAPSEKVAFLFPGLGSQYPGMGDDLAVNIPLIKEIFNKVNSESIRHNAISIIELLVADKDSPGNNSLAELLMRSDYNHPAMLAMEAGIFQAFLRAGIKPDMVAGHSLGEYSALYAAGVFDLNTLITIITTRGNELTKHCLNNGAMASIVLPSRALSPLLKNAPGFIAIANKNCPAQTVVSGDVNAVKSIVADMEEKGILCKILPVSSAYHTQLLKPCTKLFREFLNKLKIALPKIEVQSNLTGKAHKVDSNFATCLRASLVEHLVHPVEFINNILSLYKNGARLFIEIGPGSVLSSFVDNILIDKPHWTIPTNLPQRSATLQLFHALAFCAAKGLSIDLSRIIPEPKSPFLCRAPLRPMAKMNWLPMDAESAVSKMPDLINESLPGQDENSIKDYIKKRGEFLRDMLKEDFRNFKKGITATKSKETTLNHDGLQQKIVGLISRKTGYPQDYIDIDFDVEAELGLDSIKQVEIIREVAHELNINFGEDPKSQRYKITTPRKLIEACRKLLSKKTASSKIDALPQPIQAQISEKQWRINCHRWVCRRIAAPLSGEKYTKSIRNKRVLLLAGKGRLGGLIKNRLEDAGAIVSIVFCPDALEALSEDFDLVLNTWSYGEDDTVTLENVNQWWKETARRAKAVLKLGKLLAYLFRQHKDRCMQWVEVTSLGGDLGAEESVKKISAKAGIDLGIMRCLKCEFPDSLETLYIDFDLNTPRKHIAENILNELTHCRKHPEIGYVNGKRFNICWEIADAENRKQKFPLNSKSVVLAIGGARGVTASICRELAESSKAQFIIIGRSHVCIDGANELKRFITFDEARRMILERTHAQKKVIVPAEIDRLAWRHVWEVERLWNMKQLKNIASKAIYRQCDITNVGDVNQLISELRQEYPRIDLVIHGASDLILKSIEDIDANDFIENMKSKALGTACLLAALSNVEVGTFINFSSVAGRWGNTGQASYASGHEVAAILLAGARKRFLDKGINIFFGAWLNVGMVRVGNVMQRLRMRGSHFITSKAGNEFFIKELASGFSRNVAFCGQKSLRYSHVLKKKAIKQVLPAPLLDDVKVVAEGIAEGYKKFDLKHDHIIADHYVDYEKPIMPGVVSLEMIAQTAATLLHIPALSVTKIVDIDFPHPGIFPRGEPRKFYTRARLLSDKGDGALLSGEMYSIFTPPGSTKKKEMCHARCKICFDYYRVSSNPALLLVSTGIGDCHVDAKPLWETEVRRGRQGMFRTIYSFSSVTRDGVEGEVLAPKAKGFGKRPCLYNPMIIDGLLDLVNLSTDIFQGNESSLVGSIKSIEFFKSVSPGTKRHCRARIREMTESGIVYDAEAMDTKGRVVERISGVRKLKGMGDISLLPEPIWEFLRENPRQKDIRRLLGYHDKLILAQVSIPLIKGAMEAGEQGVLSEHLTEEGKIQYYKLKHVKRRLEWLAGRIVSKAAVRMYLDKDILAPADMVVRVLPDNSPYMFTDNSRKAVFLPHISISHSNDIAVSVASQSSGIGIDTEKINDSILEIADQFTEDNELAQIMVCVNCSEKEALTIIWAIKEASCKAYRAKGILVKDIMLRKAKLNGDYVICELCYPDRACVKSVAFQSSGYAYAVSRLIA